MAKNPQFHTQELTSERKKYKSYIFWANDRL